MRKSVTSVFMLALMTFIASLASAQRIANQQVRIYEDNDMLNVLCRGTDEAYSNGTRIDYFYAKGHGSKLFVDKWIERLSDSGIYNYGIGLMQIMITPRDISSQVFQSGDYPYSGALYAIRSANVYFPGKKLALKSEMTLGIMGPFAGTRSTQSTVHKLIGSSIPEGWNNQYPTDIILNLYFAAERRVARLGSNAKILSGSKISIGTMLDAVEFNSTLIAGNSSQVFNMLANRRETGGYKKSSVRIVGIFKGGILFVAHNSLLQGGLFSNRQLVSKAIRTEQGGQIITVQRPKQSIINLAGNLSLGIEVGLGRFKLSYSQTFVSALIRGRSGHAFGNITTYYSW